MLLIPSANDLMTWKHILLQVYIKLPPDVGLEKCAIAGGCLRDTLLGKEVVDIDIFHEGALIDTDDLVEQPLEIATEEYGEPIAIWNGQCFGQKVQLIQVEDLDKRLSNFSCSLSEVYFRNGLLQISPDFLHSVRDKTITFRGWCSDTYMEKMLAKFPEYKQL